jgi:arginase
MGRCAAGLATIPVVVRQHPDACVVWFDAHGDPNLPSSSTMPYLGGMVITGAAGHWDSGLGSGLQLSNVVLVGARDLDPHEKQLIGSGVLKVVEKGPQLPERLAISSGTATSTSRLRRARTGTGAHRVPGAGRSEPRRFACLRNRLAKRKVVGVEISEFESEWLDGRPGSPDKLIDAISPLINNA